jgi:hypothetical protein
MKKLKMLLFFLLFANLSNGQIRDFKSRAYLKGFNEWEIFQAECSKKVEINPLMLQSSYFLTTRLRISAVHEFIDDSINGKHLSYIHYYDKNGNLNKTQTCFLRRSKEELLPTIENIYHYNANNNLDSIEVKQQYGIVDPNALQPLIFHDFSNYCVYVDETRQNEIYREYFPNWAKGEFIRLIEYNKRDLISKVIYKVNGAVVRQIIYEYDFY